MVAFAGHSIIITGASEGIGRALARALAPQRPRLALAARDRARLASLASECRDLGAEVRVQPTDVTDSAACRALVEDTAMEFGAIDVLVNNAGGSMWTRFDRVEDPSIFETLMRLNYLGSVLSDAARTAAPQAQPRPHRRRLEHGRADRRAGTHRLRGEQARRDRLFDSLRIELRGSGQVPLLHPPRLRRLGNPSPRARARRSAAATIQWRDRGS